jgi:hypothetical protein
MGLPRRQCQCLVGIYNRGQCGMLLRCRAAIGHPGSILSERLETSFDADILPMERSPHRMNVVALNGLHDCRVTPIGVDWIKGSRKRIVLLHLLEHYPEDIHDLDEQPVVDVLIEGLMEQAVVVG